MEKLTIINLEKTEPSILIIFGATGDLTKRFLIPALYSLYLKGGALNTSIVCVARKNITKKTIHNPSTST